MKIKKMISNKNEFKLSVDIVHYFFYLQLVF